MRLKFPYLFLESGTNKVFWTCKNAEYNIQVGYGVVVKERYFVRGVYSHPVKELQHRKCIYFLISTNLMH